MKAEFQTLALVGRIDDPRIAESMHTIAAHAALRTGCRFDQAFAVSRYNLHCTVFEFAAKDP